MPVSTSTLPRSSLEDTAPLDCPYPPSVTHEHPPVSPGRDAQPVGWIGEGQDIFDRMMRASEMQAWHFQLLLLL